MSQTDSRPRSRLARFTATFTTSAGVGIFATVVDWLVLVVAVRLAGVPERWAIVPAFLAGVLVQFFGNQRLTFRAHGPATRPSDLWRQGRRFVIVEAGTLALSAFAYNLLREAAGVDYRLARVAAGLLVYVLFSLPLWHWVFSPPKGQPPAAVGVGEESAAPVLRRD